MRFWSFAENWRQPGPMAWRVTRSNAKHFSSAGRSRAGRVSFPWPEYAIERTSSMALWSMAAGSSTDAAPASRPALRTSSTRADLTADGNRSRRIINYLGADEEGVGDDETFPKANRLMSDSRCTAASVGE